MSAFIPSSLNGAQICPSELLTTGLPRSSSKAWITVSVGHADEVISTASQLNTCARRCAHGETLARRKHRFFDRSHARVETFDTQHVETFCSQKCLDQFVVSRNERSRHRQLHRAKMFQSVGKRLRAGADRYRKRLRKSCNSSRCRSTPLAKTNGAPLRVI